MKDTIDPQVLTTAAQKVFKRFPYYSKQILEEENIPYKIHGVFKNHLPISKLENAPISEK